MSQRKKPASFIKSLTFIKPSCGARSTNSPQYPQRKKNPPNISPWNPFSPRISVSPRGPLPSENAVRCLTQREAPASLHRPSAPIFSPTIPRPRFSRIAVQLGALSMLGARVGGLGVHFPQPETWKAWTCISSRPTTTPAGCTCLSHLTPPGAPRGSITSEISPQKLLPAPSSSLQSSAERLFSRASKFPRGSQTSRDCKARNSASPTRDRIPTQEPPHLALRRASPATCGNRSPSAPEPLAAPAWRLPGTEPDRATGGRGSQPRWCSAQTKSAPRLLRILNQPVNTRRLGPSDSFLDTLSDAPLSPGRPLTWGGRSPPVAVAPGRRRAHARAHRAWAPRRMAGPNRSGDAELLRSPAAGLCAAAANQAGALARPPKDRCSVRHHWPAALAHPPFYWLEASPATVLHFLFTLSAGKSRQAAPSTPAPIGQQYLPPHPLRGCFT